MNPLANLPGKPLAVLLGVSLSVLPVSYVQQTAWAAPAVDPANDACSNPDAEVKLKHREIALLGPEHAAAHANARAHQCRVAKGLEKKAAPDPQVLAAANALPSTTAGQWSDPFVIPVVGIASVLLHTGKVLFWSYKPEDYGNPAASNTGVAYVWDPATRTGHSVTPPENIWCGGQTILSDGRVFIAGGNLRYPDPNDPSGHTGWEGALSSYTFDPVSETWKRQPNMSVGRWYPTTTQLADNRVVITSGFDQSGSVDQNGVTSNVTNVVEVFTPSASAGGVGTISAVSTHDPTGLYPYQYLTQSGQMLQAGPAFFNTFLFAPNTWSWSSVPTLTTSHAGYGNGIIYSDASVTPPRQMVMIAGGENGQTAISNNEWLDIAQPGSGWQQFPHWQQARHNGNTVILPDGTLFTVGGNQQPTTYDAPLFESELYNKPANDPTGQWMQVAPHVIQAAYHSSAILLPDATVLLSQDDNNPLAASTHQAQVYSPPYMFKGARPQIVSAPTIVTLGQAFNITANTAKVASAVLIAPGAVTHANDMHQRFIKLQSKVAGNSNNVKLTIPTNRSLVPPGYYMLFIVDSSGIPSVAKFVRVT
ncbi:exported oxidase [Caballeronia arvi]|uniref:Exported oxidase n=1 Tax=Caballeronia arvi TaxID=1777135 RepID=A0A158KZ99_9BURK|nr:galactose oxidase early set domain-containing protein [Caballeronia arvi]SAL86437.1 exported oxidase [Caballeronia arvi]